MGKMVERKPIWSRKSSVKTLLQSAQTAHTDARGSGRVSYDVEDHIGILFQMYGSVWSKVLPYCLWNVLVTFIIGYLRARGIIDLAFSDKGHTFMATMVAFLSVTRSKIAYQRWNESRKLLSSMMEASRGLAQHAVVFTRREMKPIAVKWRTEVLRRTVIVLRTIVMVIQSSSAEKKKYAWDLSELNASEKAGLLLSIGTSNERSPFVLLTFLRSAIAQHENCLDTPLDVNQELVLFSYSVDLFSAYTNFRKLNLTPFPFPLVQMGRTFLFFWIFTLPFALYSDMVVLPALLVMIFFISFGFLGLEFIAIEMDDPFGDDPNDFDVYSFANVVYDDIYIASRDLDGAAGAASLKATVEGVYRVDASDESSLIHSELLGTLPDHGRQIGQNEKFMVDLNSGHVLRKVNSDKHVLSRRPRLLSTRKVEIDESHVV